MVSFVILCYQLIVTVTIYFALSTDNIMKYTVIRDYIGNSKFIYYK